jgi:small subunit ribosomal protein S9
MADKIFIGRRKTAVARAILRKGSGKITINNKDFEEYFPTDSLREDILTPFKLTETEGKYDLLLNLDGGGYSGQAEAARLAISRALLEVNEEFRTQLKPAGLLRRDPRMVERKKYGQPKARKKFQFSKR